jgi:hypothetical protein
MKETEGNPFKELGPIKDAPIAPAHGIAAIALNMALKYHDIATVQDGTLYQQYKLEGKNFRELHLDHVFETAMQMEAYLLGASERIAKIVVDAIAFKVDDEPEEAQATETASPDTGA